MQNTVGLLTWLRRGAFPCMGTVAYFPRVLCKRYSSGYCPVISPGSLSLPRDHRIRGHINFVYMDLFIYLDFSLVLYPNLRHTSSFTLPNCSS